MCDITIIWSKLKIISFRNFEHLTRIAPESEYEYLHLELESVLTIYQKYFLIDLKPLGTWLCCLHTLDRNFPFTGKNKTKRLSSFQYSNSFWIPYITYRRSPPKSWVYLGKFHIHIELHWRLHHQWRRQWRG